MQTCKIKIDSKVVANQVSKEYIARKSKLAEYLLAVRGMEKYFKGFDVEYVGRKGNTEAYELAKLASRKEPLPPDVFFKTLHNPSIKTS